MARPYELECGHCGYVFTLELEARTRSAKCPVCGGVLSLAFEMPVAPVPPPPPPPHAPPPYSPTEPAPRRKRDPDRLPPDRRVAYLAPPWREIYHATTRAALATNLIGVWSLLYFCVPPFIGFAGMPGDRRVIWQFHAGAALLILLPGAFHSLHQLRAARAGSAPDGGGFAVASSITLCVVAVLLSCILSGPELLAAGIACVGLVLAAMVLWARFLRRLGERLGDDQLMELARLFRWRLAAAVAAALMLTSGGFLPARTVPGVLFWGGQLAAGVIGLLLLRGYAVLLHTAADALARIAPVEAEE